MQVIPSVAHAAAMDGPLSQARVEVRPRLQCLLSRPIFDRVNGQLDAGLLGQRTGLVLLEHPADAGCRYLGRHGCSPYLTFYTPPDCSTSLSAHLTRSSPRSNNK